MLLATALALLIMMLNRRLLFKTNHAQVAPKETITHHFFCFERQKKTVDAAKICGGAENVVKTETQQTFVNGLLGFITLGIYTPLKRVCIAHNCMSCPSIWANFYLHCSLIYFSSFQLFFCIVTGPSLRVK